MTEGQLSLIKDSKKIALPVYPLCVARWHTPSTKGVRRSPTLWINATSERIKKKNTSFAALSNSYLLNAEAGMSTMVQRPTFWHLSFEYNCVYLAHKTNERSREAPIFESNVTIGKKRPKLANIWPAWKRDKGKKKKKRRECWTQPNKVIKQKWLPFFPILYTKKKKKRRLELLNVLQLRSSCF